MDEAAITQYITSTFEKIETITASGSTFFYYHHDPSLPLDDRFPFITLVTSDDAYDNFSNLDRPGVFRLNIGVSKETYRSLFGTQPAPASAEEARASSYDFTALDQVMPHPVYGRQYWVSVLNPRAETFQAKVQPLLAEAYERVVGKHTRRAARD